MPIEDALLSAFEHCGTCRDRATGAALPQVRMLPKQQACRNATCVPSPLKRCVAAAMINGVGAALGAPRHIARVHLTRTNVVKHALSQLSLWQNHNTVGSDPLSARSPKRVNATRLIETIDRTERARRLQANYLRGTAFFVSYEGLQIEPQAELDAIFRVMKVSPTPLAVPLVEGKVFKTTSDDLRSSVENFDDVAAALLREKGKCYHDMWVAAEPREFQACA